MGEVRGIVVCVEYDDLLALTLPRNMPHLKECLVVTTPWDSASLNVAARYNARVYTTDVFYAQGAKFNKGAAIEEGLDALGRDGWILIWDADTMLPESAKWPELQVGSLYSTPRRLLPDPRQWSPDLDWSRLHRAQGEPSHIGYCQLFHATDPVLQSRPWYPVNCPDCSRCDMHFRNKWPRHQWQPLPFEVLHLGPKDTNWVGRCSPRLDGTVPEQAGKRAAEMARLHVQQKRRRP